MDFRAHRVHSWGPMLSGLKSGVSDDGRSLSSYELEQDADADADADVLPTSYGRDILVVDDHQTNLIAIRAALQPLGRSLVLARSSIEVLGRLLEQDFALILLDVSMPGMDGLEIARLVRARDRSRATPILCMTGSSQGEAMLRGYELGAFDCLATPIRPEVLRAKASAFIQLQDLAIELQHKTLEVRQARAYAHELIAQRERFATAVLEQQRQQAAETDRRKDEFLAILSHELRNPLQPLQTAVEVLEHDPRAPVPARVRGIIQRQVHHITRLVDDLLDIARLNAGKLELRREPVALEAIVQEAVQSCRTTIEARKHQLEVELGGAPTIIDGDPIRLVQVVCNLLNNAAKYTDSGGLIRVACGAHCGEGFIRITDTGKGISPILLPSIFDMFVQERTTPDGAGGLGLGLGLVKRVVEMHGGTVCANSAGPKQGSTFEILLGLADQRGLDAFQLSLTRTPTGPQERPLRAVVCDDAPDLCELVADLLRLRGHEVIVVEDGPAAIATICQERPDVALIDIGLPEMDGYEVARQIRRALTEVRPRLIAMTGYGQASDRAAAFDAGFDDHIVKPASADKILRALYGTQD